MLEAITMHHIFFIQDNEHQPISSVSSDMFGDGVYFDDSVAMRVLKRPNFRPLELFLVRKCENHYSNLILPYNRDSRCFNVGEKLPALLYKLLDIEPKY